MDSTIYEFIQDKSSLRFQYWIIKNKRVSTRHSFDIALAEIPAVVLTMMEIQLQEASES